MVATPPMYCRICTQPLDVAGDYAKDGVTWTNIHHTHPPWYEADHEPDPAMIVDYAEILAHCDFCLAEIRDGGWTYPAKDFVVMVEMAPGHVTEHGSAGDWCTCDDCHQDIETKKWDSIKNRSVTYQKVPAKNRHEISMFMKNLWVGFEKNRTGPAYHEQRQRKGQAR